jgi:hypothetical protein
VDGVKVGHHPAAAPAPPRATHNLHTFHCPHIYNKTRDKHAPALSLQAIKSPATATNMNCRQTLHVCCWLWDACKGAPGSMQRAFTWNPEPRCPRRSLSLSPLCLPRGPPAGGCCGCRTWSLPGRWTRRRAPGGGGAAGISMARGAGDANRPGRACACAGCARLRRHLLRGALPATAWTAARGSQPRA